MTGAGSTRARRTAIRLLRWYPRPWRVRYEREMQALLEDMPVGWTQVANLAGTAAREWMSPRALGWPSRSAAMKVMAARFLMFTAFAYALDGVSRIVIAQMSDAQIKTWSTFEDYAIWVLMALLVRVITAGTLRVQSIRKSRWRAFLSGHRWLQYLSDWEVVAWLVALFPYMIVRNTLPTPDYYSVTSEMRTVKPIMDYFMIYVWTDLLVMNSARRDRLRKVNLGSHKRPLGLAS